MPGAVWTSAVLLCSYLASRKHMGNQHAHIISGFIRMDSVVNPHSPVFKGEDHPKEQPAVCVMHFVLIPTDDWPITAKEMSRWDIMLSPSWTINVRCQPPSDLKREVFLLRWRSTIIQAGIHQSRGRETDQNAMLQLRDMLFGALALSTYMNNPELITNSTELYVHFGAGASGYVYIYVYCFESYEDREKIT